MPKEPTCPICGAILVEDDCYDTHFEEGEVIMYIVGHCDECNKSYQWTRVYDFSGIGEIEEN